ncbi:MAG: hemerythrin domain-containing protein [Blastocatellia bacterium]|nr:hemerythrin domain-containing protein [Blastocatellia bacterium]
MKRHKSLVSLSREHHLALVQAYNLRYLGSEKITLPTQEVVEKFLSFWEEELVKHFRKEEEILLPKLARYSKDHTGEITQLLLEHLDLRCRLDELKSCVRENQLPSLRTLNEFGEQLYKHIRFEEDKFFALVEENLPESELKQLLELLENN